MAYRPLRQPKTSALTENKSKPMNESLVSNSNRPDTQQMIVTLKNSSKLVVSSDAYHGILTAGDKYLCALCDVEFNMEGKRKNLHKVSMYHNKTLESSPYIEEYMTNLVRQINSKNFYCTTCNVVVMSHFISRHLSSEIHCLELEKAINKSIVYEPLYD